MRSVIVQRIDGQLLAGRADGDDFSWLKVGADVFGSEDNDGLCRFTPAYGVSASKADAAH